MTTQDEIDARFAAMQPDPTRKLDERFMVTRALLQEVAALKDENARLRDLARYFVFSEWHRVYIGGPLRQLKITITDEQLDEMRRALGQGE